MCLFHNPCRRVGHQTEQNPKIKTENSVTIERITFNDGQVADKMEEAYRRRKTRKKKTRPSMMVKLLTNMEEAYRRRKTWKKKNTFPFKHRSLRVQASCVPMITRLGKGVMSVTN